MHYGICMSYIIWDIKYLQSMYAYGITPAHYLFIFGCLNIRHLEGKGMAAICFCKNGRVHQTKT